MRLADELTVLREKLEQLERGTPVIGDWQRLEARVARALVAAGCELTVGEIDLERSDLDEIEELRSLRLYAECRRFELEACCMHRE